ncbi:hypothetical protein E4339_05935 [Salmonella enterica subsp. enterica serovar Waycross]|nr:hypothetical protein [Salmonella enterica subsp. enterica serovar Waycross]
MSIEIVRLKIVANTNDGVYGVDIPFKTGLFLLRVENTHGKSTCMNAIAYALGMERALGQSGTRPPFPASLTKSLLTKEGKEVSIISSYVLLQIRNDKNMVTLKRTIVGATDNNIINVFEAPLDLVPLHSPKPLYLHREGDTSRDLGFYYWFGKFAGWNIPLVPNHNGGESPLYPSVIFPTWFVEQKKGWSSIQATTPTYFNIKEPKKRAVEFVLSLDVNENIKKRNSLKSKIDDIVYQWKLIKRKADLISAKVSGVVTGIPEQPESKFDNYKIDIVIKTEERVISIVDVKSSLENELREYSPLEETISDNYSLELATLESIREHTDKIKDLEILLQNVSDERSYIHYQISATKRRISNLLDDKRKYEDIRKVADSSTFENSSILINECPTCGASFSDNLLELSVKDNVMTYEDSLSFIKEQIKAFEFVLTDSDKQLQIKQAEQKQLETEIANLRSNILRLKSHKNPSIAIQEDYLRKKINLENGINDIDEALNELLQIKLDLETLFKRYMQLTGERKKLPASVLSVKDFEKVKFLNESLKNRLDKYTFSSFKVEQIEISDENYLPTREGFDIGFEVSASDGIRMIWGYLISLFMVGKKFGTNHPGIVIFDEPRQQETNKFSFSELLKDAARSSVDGGQIIFATSEEEDVLVQALVGEKYTMCAFKKADGKLIRKFA